MLIVSRNCLLSIYINVIYIFSFVKKKSKVEQKFRKGREKLKKKHSRLAK